MRMIIAGGGTGGHLFPGIAIAKSFQSKDHSNAVLFVNSGTRFEKDVLKREKYEYKCIPSAGFKGKKIFSKLSSVLKIPAGIFKSILIITAFKPDIVVGIGSYSSGPAVLAAWLMRISIVIHEQNILPGVTNRILFNLANRIYLSFDCDDKHAGSVLKKRQKKKAIVTGNPVRFMVADQQKSQKDINKKDDDSKPFTVLILGGSQGAQSINFAVMEAIDYLDKKDFFIVHQTGIKDEEYVNNYYEKKFVFCKVKSFFSDINKQYAKADLIICRAGATTVAEITALGKCALFIPYPFASDNHQVLNARYLVNSDAGDMILQNNLDGKILAEKIKFYKLHPEIIKSIEQKSKKLGRLQAAEIIINDCYKLLGF